MFEKFIKKEEDAEENEVANHALFHDEGLHDQDETQSGEKFHLHDMKPIDNSSDDPGAPEMHVVGKVKKPEGKVIRMTSERDVLPPVYQEEDAAEKWLRENDPEHPQYKYKKAQ